MKGTGWMAVCMYFVLTPIEKLKTVWFVQIFVAVVENEQHIIVILVNVSQVYIWASVLNFIIQNKYINNEAK